MLKPGDRIPDLTLPGPGGAPRSLLELAAKKTLVVYFYPKDETLGCTVEACSFRDAYEDFTSAGAEVVGISDDSVESHESFAKNHRLPFILLSDPGGAARKAFGVQPSTFGLVKGRVTFVVDRGGIVRMAFESQVRVNKHVREALDAVRRLEAA
jgi:peroxiredoxin Q/BCP